MEYMIKENAEVGLHDCRTKKIVYEGDIISFYFPDGFYYIKDSTAKESRNAVMKCHFYDKYDERFSVYLYRKTLFGKIIREDISKDFVSDVNRGKFEYEFVYTYRSFHGILFKGYVWRKKKPWWRECEIELKVDEITYSWDEYDENTRFSVVY